MRHYWFAAIVVLSGCANAPAPNGAQAGSGSTTTAGTSGEGGGSGLRLSLHQVTDTNGTGKLAGTYLLPEGYTAVDEIKWIPNAYLTPVVGTTVLTSADGQIVMEAISGVQNNFGHGPGSDWGVDPPKSVSSYLLRLWKKAHPSLSATVLDNHDASIADASHSGPGYRMYGKRGFLKLRYTKDGVTYLVRSHTRIDVMSTIPAPTAIGGTLYEGGWVTSNWYTVTAPEDKLPDAMKLFGIVLASTRTDPHFFNTVMQAREIIQRNFYARQNQIMETSRIISQTNDEITAQMDSSYHSAETTQEHEATGFDDYIRGIDRYQESDGSVSLPSGYAHAFSDGAGRYIVTDQHGYDPNVTGPGGTWHEMEKTK